MSSRTRRRFATAAVGTVGALTCLTTSAQAVLTSPASTAYVVSATAIGNLIDVAPTPTSAFPPGGTNTVASLAVGAITSASLLTATTAGSVADGTSSASATAASVGLNLAGLATGSVTGINSNCQAPATPGVATGDGTITGGSITLLGGVIVPLTIGAPANTNIPLLGVGNVVLNEQSTDADGVLTVNAVHITLLSGAGSNIILGHVTCGGAPPVVATPMISEPIAAGSAATAAVAGVVYLRRRRVSGGRQSV